MTEACLRDFFLGRTSASALANDLAGTDERLSGNVTSVHVRSMEEEFEVTSAMAIKLCDAILAGELQPQALESIGFALVASDHFTFKGKSVLGSVIHDWAAPEINYPLNIESVGRFKRWLAGEEPYPARG